MSDIFEKFKILKLRVFLLKYLPFKLFQLDCGQLMKKVFEHIIKQLTAAHILSIHPAISKSSTIVLETDG